MFDVVDTNVILRFLVGDSEVQKNKAKKWFQEAREGKRKLLIKPIVVAESCFVLESFYKKKRNEIASAFETLLSQKWLKVDDRKALLSMWNRYRQGLHFVDSFLLAWSDNNDSNLLTFDGKLNKLAR